MRSSEQNGTGKRLRDELPRDPRRTLGTQRPEPAARTQSPSFLFRLETYHEFRLNRNGPPFLAIPPRSRTSQQFGPRPFGGGASSVHLYLGLMNAVPPGGG
ncbi:unnamed protein product, partial [Nesidiocoris tenuis]